MGKNAMNPLITTDDITPSIVGMKVEGVFNAGVTMLGNEIILLLRVAESFMQSVKGEVLIPVVSDSKIEAVRIDKTDEKYDFTDSRIVTDTLTKETKYLTSISHLRIARSTDGINFKIDAEMINLGSDKLESWGVEDPRIITIGDMYYINYTSVSPYGACTSLVTTKDFKEFSRKGVIFPVENKDVCIYNEKINDMYYAYHRPVPKAFGSPDIWIASSPDLVHYGNHKHFLGIREGDYWDNNRIGGGAPPIKTDSGWLSIYHACNKENVYCLGAFLTPLDDPYTITMRSPKPIVMPTEDYEIEGFFGNVVFSCGAIKFDDSIVIYYGASDDKICRVDLTIQEIIESMEVQ